MELLPIQMAVDSSLRILWGRLSVLLLAIGGGILVLLTIEGAFTGRPVTILGGCSTLAIFLYLTVLLIRRSNSLQTGALDEVLLNRGLECYRLGEYKRAKSLYIQALTHKPVNSLALNNIAYALLNEGGKPRAALVLSDLALFCSGQAMEDAAALDTNAWAHFKVGRGLKKAEAYLRLALPKVVATGNSDHIIEVLYHLMAVLNARENVLDAVDCYRALVMLPPGSVYARQALDDHGQLEFSRGQLEPRRSPQKRPMAVTSKPANKKQPGQG